MDPSSRVTASGGLPDDLGPIPGRSHIVTDDSQRFTCESNLALGRAIGSHVNIAQGL
jgi:hypothetical protein